MTIILLFHELAVSVKMANDHKHTLLDYDKSLTLIGQGRSAYVFRIEQTNKAMKIFFPTYAHLAEEEANIYRELQHLSYFPTLYEAGSNYLVIDYLEGNTLFQCLTKGTPISDDVIKETDKALQLARKEGLNPSDVHLRNIFITSDKEVKIIDVARFRQVKVCTQWEDLKNAFYCYYKKPYFPKKIPEFMLNSIAALYKKNLLKVNRARSSEFYQR